MNGNVDQHREIYVGTPMPGKGREKTRETSLLGEDFVLEVSGDLDSTNVRESSNSHSLSHENEAVVEEKTALIDFAKEMKVKDPESQWFSSGLRHGEISHSDLKRMSLSFHKSKSYNSAQAEDPKEIGTIKALEGTALQSDSYALLLVYEITAMELIYGEVENEDFSSSGMRCFPFCFPSIARKNRKTHSTAFLRNSSITGGRSVFAECSIIEDNNNLSYLIQENHPGDARMDEVIDLKSKTQIQKAPTIYNSLSPSWKAPGVANVAALRKRPQVPLLAWSVDLPQILNGSFHIEFWDEFSGDLVAFTDFELKKLFETSFGNTLTPHMKNLMITKEMRLKVYQRRKKLAEEAFKKTGEILGDYGNSSAFSPNGGTSSKDGDDDEIGGRLRVRIAVLSNYYMVDLLKGPDENHIFTALSIILRMVQFCDIQQLAKTTGEQSDSMISSDSKPSSEDHSAHPLRILLRKENLQYLFSALEIIEKNPEYVNNSFELKNARKRLSTLISMIFQAGLTRIGPFFANSFESFGEEVSSFTDLTRFDEQTVLLFLDVIQQLPLKARHEALNCNDGALIHRLVKLCSIEMIEDTQVKALQLLNSFAEQLKENDYWIEFFLKKLLECNFQHYLAENLESWHPQLSEEATILFSVMVFRNQIQLDSETISSLRRVESEHSVGRLAGIVQRMLFSTDFNLKLLPLSFVKSSCETQKKIFKLSNVVSQHTPEAHTPRGVYKDVDIVIKIDCKSHATITHLVACSPIWTSTHAAHSMLILLTKTEPTASELMQISSLPDERVRTMIHDPQTVPIDWRLRPYALFNFDQDAFQEMALPQPVEASFMVIRLNPGGQFRSSSHIEVDYVAAIGFDQSEFQPQRSHLELKGSIVDFLQLKAPRPPNVNTLPVNMSQESIRNLPS